MSTMLLFVALALLAMFAAVAHVRRKRTQARRDARRARHLEQKRVWTELMRKRSTDTGGPDAGL